MTIPGRRGVLLDSRKVRTYAAQINADSCSSLQKKFLERYPDISYDSKTVIDAWNCKKNIDKHKAELLATLFGLDSYQPLLIDNIQSCAWLELINNEQYAAKFMRLIGHNHADLNMVKIRQKNHDGLSEILLDTDWHIELQGNQHEFIFIVLCSGNDFFQLAPIEGEGLGNIFTENSLRYPQDFEMSFDDAYGTGWRQFIAIRARYMDCQIKNAQTSYCCTLEELNQLARRTLDRPGNNIAVDSFEFMLVHTSAHVERLG